MACSEWNVPFLPVNPWVMTLVPALTRMDISDFQFEAVIAPLRRLLDRIDDLLRRIVEIVRRNDVEAGLADDPLAEVDVGPFQAHDKRNLKANLLHSGDHPLGDDVAAHDAAKNIDEYPLNVGIGGDDLERSRDFVLRRAAANVEKIRRTFPIELDDVHGRHGEAGAVDHASDRAVESDVVEIVLGGFDLLGVFFAFVP